MEDEKPKRERKTKKRITVNGMPAEEYYKEYFLKNREELYQKRKDKKFFCRACNKEYTYECRYLHLRTKKHLQAQELYNLKNVNQSEEN